MRGSSSVSQEPLETIRQYGGKIKETYGVPVSEIVEDIKFGVRKVNVDTDTRLAMTAALRKKMAENPEEFDPRVLFTVAIAEAKKVCKDRFEAFGSAGHASQIKVIAMEAMAARYAKYELSAAVK
jgi:fructose-bisphosphate aldolase class II